MNQLTLKEHGAWIKQMLIQKSLVDLRDNGKEIRFEQPVLNEMRKQGLSRRTVHRFISDFPIESLKSSNRAYSRYLIQISGTHGKRFIRLDLEMTLDKSGLDVAAVNLRVNR